MPNVKSGSWSKSTVQYITLKELYIHHFASAGSMRNAGGDYNVSCRVETFNLSFPKVCKPLTHSKHQSTKMCRVLKIWWKTNTVQIINQELQTCWPVLLKRWFMLARCCSAGGPCFSIAGWPKKQTKTCYQLHQYSTLLN